MMQLDLGTSEQAGALLGVDGNLPLRLLSRPNPNLQAKDFLGSFNPWSSGEDYQRHET
jgi:hypothetical protein